MKPFYNFLLFFMIFQSCIPKKVLYTNYGITSLKKPINKIINDSNVDVSLGIKIVSLKNGKTLYELNSEKLFTPASNNKLYTLGASLHYLGEDHIFTTSVLQDGKNLILKGSGDPDLTVAQLDSLAIRSAQSINFVDTLFLDATLMDSVYFGNGWMWDEGPWWYAAPISALSLNDNCIDFIINPGEIDEPANIKTYPKTDYISISNNSLTIKQNPNIEKIFIERDFIKQKNHFTISGSIKNGAASDTLKRNIKNPALFTGTIFKELLNKYGVVVNQIAITSITRKSIPIALHTSKSLLHSAQNLMNESDNLTAELFVKKIGLTNHKQGDWKNGLHNIKIFLNDSVGIDTTLIKIVDGSGLSRYNLTSASEICTFLEWIFNSQHKNDFISCLPTGGMKKGTMEDRLKIAGDMIRVKTGGLSGVTNISGYIFSPRYGPIAFSILTNGYIGDSNPYRSLQDKIIQYIIDD